MTERSTTRKIWLAVGGVLIALMLAAVFTLGSLNLPFEPTSWEQIIVLYALSTFIVAALLVFGLVLTRSFLRLWAERRAEQLGSRFKSKMVAGAMAISLLPVVFMFFISYALLNRTLAKWFPRPLEIATEQSQQLLSELGAREATRLKTLAEYAASFAEPAEVTRTTDDPISVAISTGADGAWIIGRDGKVEAARQVYIDRSPRFGFGRLHPLQINEAPKLIRDLPSGVGLWESEGRLYLAATTPLKDGKLFVAREAPGTFAVRYGEIEKQLATYEAQKQQLRAFKTQMLLTLLLFTILLLFSATWFALFLSKQVTVPIQALAEATREVSHGNFAHRVDVQAQDELGILVQSFNQMTAQLGESRGQIDEFTRNLQQAVEEIEQRRKVMEAILENIPTGVVSLDEHGAIRRVNPAVASIFGERARTAKTLAELLGADATRNVELLIRKSLRMGVASKELEIPLPHRVLHAAVTVSALGTRRSNPGFVVVVDDLTELLRAQKATAWQEVAQRIAHEIKNPLTPIQLSAQRLSRHLERAPASDGELRALVGECASLIEREVSTLKSLVDEFSQFARFPAAKLAPADLNDIVAGALDVFRDRLEGITLRVELARELPSIKADPELLHRVVVNLVDNAAEALEGSSARELTVRTRLDAEKDAVEIIVADSGHGISPEDKDRLFLPHFSTKERGTGLGLAIASRIIAEHNGTIRVEDNQPVGSRFVVRLPLSEVPAAQPRSFGANGQERA